MGENLGLKAMIKRKDEGLKELIQKKDEEVRVGEDNIETLRTQVLQYQEAQKYHTIGGKKSQHRGSGLKKYETKG